MHPYRDGKPQEPLTAFDRFASYQAARYRIGGAIVLVLGAGLIPTFVKGCEKTERPTLDISEALLNAAATFPGATRALKQAAPLAPLRAATEPEQCAATEPGPAALNVRPGEPIRVRFNRPMVEARMVHKPVAKGAVVRFSPAVAGEFKWTSRSAGVFTPDGATWGKTKKATMTLADGLQSLGGEDVADFDPRTVVFDDGPRFYTHKGTRVAPGEALGLFFSGKVDVSALGSQMLVYEVDGGRRTLGFTLAEHGFDKSHHARIDVKIRELLDPGAKLGVALSPVLGYGGLSPRALEFEIAPRPKVEGFDCPDGAKEASACAFAERPGRILDIGAALRLVTSTDLGPLPKTAVELSPPLPKMIVKVEDKRRLVISGDWDPGQVYEVKVAGLVDTDGRELARMGSLAVRSEGRAPAVIPAKAGRIAIEKDAAPALPFRAVHVEGGEARVAAVPAGAEIEAALATSSFVAPDREDTWKKVPLHDLAPTSRPNRWGHGAFPWMDAAGKGASTGAERPAGWSMSVVSLLADASARKLAAPPASLVMHTDLGVDAKVNGAGVLVWVTSIGSAKPVANAKVQVADLKGQPIATGTTDARGVANVLAPAGSLPGGAAVAVVAGDDRAVVVVDQRTSIRPSHFDAQAGDAAPEADAWVATVFTDRGICRPGETIHAKAIVRTRSVKGSNPTAPGPANVTMRLFGPSGQAPVAEQIVALSAFGTADATFPIADGGAMGSWRVEVKQDGREKPAGSAAFKVGDYRPPTFKIEIATDKGVYVDREKLTAQIEARYMFGTPAVGASAAWTLVREPADYADRWVQFTFTPADAPERGGTVTQGDVVIGDAGKATIDAAVAIGGSRRESETLEVTVRDASGLTTSARKTVVVRPSAFEVGLMSQPTWLEDGVLDAEAIVIDDQDASVAGRKIEARFIREGWHSYYAWSRHAGDDDAADAEAPAGDAGASTEEKKGAFEGRRAKKRDVAHTCDMISAAEPVHCTWKPEHGGTYVIEVTTKDDDGRVSTASQRVYVPKKDEHPERDAPGTAITLTPTKPRYEVGDKAEIGFESPFPDADALFTVERDGVVVLEERRVASGAGTFRFPVTAEMTSNVFVTLALVRPRTGPPQKKVDVDGPDLRVGFAEVGVRPAVKPLEVKVDVADKARAGEKVTVKVHVADAAGKGVSSEVALFAVDEATLRVTNYQLGDPLAGLFPRLNAGFAWEDIRRQLLARSPDPLAESAGGDGGEVAGKRPVEEERFDPTPLWLPKLVTDANGDAAATIDLPARATQYRVMAVATDAATRAGRGEKNVIATMPVVVRPVMPKGVVVGDRFFATAFVHNTEDEAADVTVAIDAAGAKSTETLHLAAHAEEKIGAWVDVKQPGALPVVFEARTARGGATPVVTKAVVSASRPVREVHSEAVGALVDARDITLDMPETTGGGMTLSIAAFPFVGFEDAFEAASEDTGSSVEAAASSLVALSAQATLDVVKQPGGASAGEIKARATAAVARLVRAQTRSGGWGDFSAESPPDPYLTAYVLHALAAAQRAGLAEPKQAIAQARVWLLGESREASFIDRGEGGHDDLAFALRALTETGSSGDNGRIEALFKQRERLTPYGLAQLALAMSSTDRRRDTLALEAAERVLVTREDEKKNPRVLRWYDSSARTLGAVLEAAMDVDVATSKAGAIASKILDARVAGDGAWWSPHETAYALEALAAYAGKASGFGKFAPVVTLDGAPLAAATTTPGVLTYTFTAREIAGKKRALHIASPGQAWFSLASHHEQALGAFDAIARGEQAALHRVLEDAHGKVIGPGDHVKLGELVRVRLFFFSERETPAHVLVRDRLAAGLEALDGGHETSPRNSLWSLLGMGPEDDTVDARGALAATSLGQITQEITTPAGSLFYLSRGAVGLRELTYGARATAVGTFQILPAEATSLYVPSFVARSAMTTITVDP